MIILNTLYLILYTPVALAQSVDLGISPPLIQIDAKAPADIKTPISIENYSNESLELIVVLKPFKAAKNGNGQLVYLTDKEFHPADPQIFDKMQLLENDHVKDTIRLGPRQQKTLALHIGIPKGEPKTDYYFSIVFISKAAENKDQTSSQTPAGVATNVLLSIGPKGPTTGLLEHFSVPFLMESGPVPFSLRVKNTSDHVITPEGQILIKNMYNQTIGRVDLLPVNILADSSRDLPDSLMSVEQKQSKDVASLRQQQAGDVAIWPEKLIFGLYTATLTVALSDQGPLFRKTIYFVGLPIQAVVTLLVILVVIIFIIARVKAKLK